MKYTQKWVFDKQQFSLNTANKTTNTTRNNTSSTVTSKCKHGSSGTFLRCYCPNQLYWYPKVFAVTHVISPHLLNNFSVRQLFWQRWQVISSHLSSFQCADEAAHSKKSDKKFFLLSGVTTTSFSVVSPLRDLIVPCPKSGSWQLVCVEWRRGVLSKIFWCLCSWVYSASNCIFMRIHVKSPGNKVSSGIICWHHRCHASK